MSPRPRSPRAPLLAVAGLALVASAVAADAVAAPPEPARHAPATAAERPVTLAEVVAGALARNLEVQAGAVDPVVACEKVTIADAAFDVLLTASATAGRVETPAEDSFSGSSVTAEEVLVGDASLERRYRDGSKLAVVFHADRLLTNSAVALTSPRWVESSYVEWTKPLLRGSGCVATAEVRRASIGVTGAQETQRALVERVLYEAERAYWELEYAQEEVKAREKSLEVASSLRDLVGERRRAGVAAPLDATEADAGVAAREGDLAAARARRGAAEDAVRLVSAPFEGTVAASPRLVAADDPRAASPADEPGDLDEARWVGAALRDRPDLRAASAEVDQLEVDVEVARDAWRPQLDLVARVGSSGLGAGYGDAFQRFAEAQATTATFGLSLSVWLGRRAAEAEVRTAEWIRRQAGLRRREKESRAVAEVRAALRDLATAGGRASAAGREIASARAVWEGERERQRVGDSTPFRVLEREEEWTKAVTREGRAAADARIARAALWRSVGRLANVRGACPPR
jgi:outer membrane protein TolC